jgi:hypothetical protein
MKCSRGKGGRRKEGVKKFFLIRFYYLFLVITLVIACLIVMPALSISFRDSPVVMQAFRAGCDCQPTSFGVA